MTDNAYLHQLKKHIRQGGIIAYPTEGVWGLGCDPFNEAAVNEILQIKGREVEKGLILVASSLAQIYMLMEGLPEEAKHRLESSCPGPETWLIPDPNQAIPSWIKGKFATVAIRVSKHPVVVRLCDELGLLVSTSANPADREPALSEEQVKAYFPECLSAGKLRIVPGELGGQRGPSRIVDLMSRELVRE